MSLTDTNDNLAMWNHYADNGVGFYIGFNGKALFKTIRSYGKVEYVDELPEIFVGEPYGIQTWKQIFNKEQKWSLEREHRFHKFNINGLTTDARIAHVPKDCFEQIVFGWKMSEEDRNSIINSCNSQQLPVTFFQAELVNNLISINPVVNN